MVAIISPVADLVIGVSLGVLAGFFFNIGAVYLKKGVATLKDITLSDLNTIWALFKSRTWVFGLILGVAGNVPYLIAQSFAGIAIVQPLTNTGYIAMAIFATKVLGERLRPAEKGAIGLLIVAPFFLSLASVSRVSITTLNLAVWGSFFLFSAIIVVLLVGIFVVKKKVLARGGELLAVSSGCMYGISSLSAQLITISLGPLLTAGTVHGVDWWALLPSAFVWLVTNLIAGLWQQQGLQKTNASRAIPLSCPGNLTIPVVGGILIFGQIVGNWVFFLLGVVIIGIAVAMFGRLQAEIDEKYKRDPIPENKKTPEPELTENKEID
jgi:drug/metabolite transporter (DMT)-like permease